MSQTDAYLLFIESRKSFCSPATVGIYKNQMKQIITNETEYMEDVTFQNLPFIFYANEHSITFSIASPSPFKRAGFALISSMVKSKDSNVSSSSPVYPYS